MFVPGNKKYFRRLLLFLLIICAITGVKGQTVLRVTRTFLGTVRIYDVYPGEEIGYRLKGKVFLRKNTVAHFSQDSTIIFDHAPPVKFDALRTIRFSRHIHILTTFKNAFAIAAVGFFALNTVNNLITGNHPVLSEKAAVISGGLAAVSITLRFFEKKRIRIGKRTSLSVLERNYENLNSK
jgi:hypothetical protein